jgi:hypothetical protein
MSCFFPEEGWSETEDPVPRQLIELLPNLSWDGDLKIKSRSLPFYPGSQFLMLHSSSWTENDLFIYALVSGEDFCWLNGTSPALHEFNRRGHISLTGDNALAYLKFFCFCVRGEEGAFYVIDSLKAPYLPVGLRAGTEIETLVDVKERFQERFQSPRAFSVSDDGKWRFSATIYYSNAIFLADLLVESTGMVQMVNDTAVLADLPVKISAPIAPKPVPK